MNIVQITPGAGGMYCGGCFRDNALVTALRRLGHEALMVPLYLPLTLDEPDQSAGTPIFFGGISVYLEQKWAPFRHLPDWLHALLSTRPLLRWAAGRAAKTRAEDVGELTISMLRGEQGFQARELDELIDWLKHQARPDVVCLSNALLIGLARRLKSELGVPVVCLLSGEDTFLDSLPATVRPQAWKTLAERCPEIDLFLSPSRYYGELMTGRLSLPPARVQVLPNGLNLAGYAGAVKTSGPPVLGFFARMCREKGLDLLVDTYLHLRRLPAGQTLKLHVGGGCGPGDEPFVQEQREKLAAAGALADVEFHPNVDHAAKIAFFQRLTVFCTPALYGEAFGLYVVEALAAGVPVVQPRHAAFPELLAATEGGVLCEPTPARLAEGIAELLQDPARARELGRRGQEVVQQRFTQESMAQAFAQMVAALLPGRSEPRT